MAKIIPFRAVRPPRSTAALTATRSYISYTDEERDEKLRNNPYSFMHIIHPPGTEDMSGKPKFKQVRSTFLEYISKGRLMKEDRAAFYIYEQSYDGCTFKGIIAGIAVSDYENGTIKKHEHTLTKRENMFKEYLETTKMNAEPVLLVYSRQKTVDDIIETYEKTRPEYEFTTTDMHDHKLWVVKDKEDIQILEKAFASLESVYIADGHHRCASSALLGTEKRNHVGGSDQKMATDYFSAYLISDHNMEIKPFYRGVKFKNNTSPNEFLEGLNREFDVAEKGNEPIEPQNPHTIGLYLEKTWYELRPKAGTFDKDDPVGVLDCHIISVNVFDKLLGITDEKTDPNIQFIPAVNGVSALMESVNNGTFDAGFVPPPVLVEQLKTVADKNMIMPPKSTWVEPKLLSGLIIYDIHEL